MKKRLFYVIGYFTMAVTVFLLTRNSLSANLRNSVYLLLLTGAIISLSSLFKKAKERTMVNFIFAYVFLIQMFVGNNNWLFVAVLLISVISFVITSVIKAKKLEAHRWAMMDKDPNGKEFVNNIT